jgi:hypothetical protein
LHSRKLAVCTIAMNAEPLRLHARPVQLSSIILSKDCLHRSVCDRNAPVRVGP